MKYGTFFAKLASLLMIFAALWQYQTVAQIRAAEVAENAAAVAEAESWNAHIRQVLSGEQEAAPGYLDGTYEGEGTGFGGQITVSVSIAQGQIAEITVLSAEDEDPAYYALAESVLEKMQEVQSAQVDTVSGATYSSGGIIAAVEDALGKAVA